MIVKPLLPKSAARVFFDGVFHEPRLAHPEGVAVHVDGSIWCGTETGDLMRIEPDGSKMRRLASSGGFLLGLAFDSKGNCYACDLKHQAIFRYLVSNGSFERFAAGGIKVPNFPVVDEKRGKLFVSDSRGNGNIGPGVFSFDLQTGKGGVWCDHPMDFANGMIMAPDNSGLYVVESDTPSVLFVPIRADGTPGPVKTITNDVQVVPDGLAWDVDGSLLISCYEPSRIYRLKSEKLEILFEDERATVMAHPTNMARRGDTLFTANLGRWHITAIDLSGIRTP